jgi:hypothetical protein
VGKLDIRVWSGVEDLMIYRWCPVVSRGIFKLFLQFGSHNIKQLCNHTLQVQSVLISPRPNPPSTFYSKATSTYVNLLLNTNVHSTSTNTLNLHLHLHLPNHSQNVQKGRLRLMSYVIPLAPSTSIPIRPHPLSHPFPISNPYQCPSNTY